MPGAGNAGPTSITIAAPSTAATTDYVVLLVNWVDSSGGTVPVLTPSASGATFTTVQAPIIPNTTNMGLAVYTVTGLAANTVVTVTFDGSKFAAMWMAGWDASSYIGWGNVSALSGRNGSSSTQTTSGAFTARNPNSTIVDVWSERTTAAGTYISNYSLPTLVDIYSEGGGTAGGSFATDSGAITERQPGSTSVPAVTATYTGAAGLNGWVLSLELLPVGGSVAPAAEVTSGTGVANDAAPSVAPNAENIAVTVAANDATVTTAVVAAAEVTSATVVANDAAPSVAPNAEATAVTVAANDATVTTGVNAAAENTAVTGAANDATVNVSTSGGEADVTGAANDAAASEAPPAGEADDTTVANDAGVDVSTAGGNAAVTGTANDPTVVVGTLANAEATSVTVTAYDATTSSPAVAAVDQGGAAFGWPGRVAPPYTQKPRDSRRGSGTAHHHFTVHVRGVAVHGPHGPAAATVGRTTCTGTGSKGALGPTAVIRRSHTAATEGRKTTAGRGHIAQRHIDLRSTGSHRPSWWTPATHWDTRLGYADVTHRHTVTVTGCKHTDGHAQLTRRHTIVAGGKTDIVERRLADAQAAARRAKQQAELALLGII